MTDKPSPRRQEWLRQRQRSRRRVRLWQAGLLAALLGLWQLTTAVGLSDGFLISSPSRMAATFVSLCRGGDLWRHIGVSCGETVIGFLSGTALGTGTGFINTIKSFRNTGQFFFFHTTTGICYRNFTAF